MNIGIECANGDQVRKKGRLVFGNVAPDEQTQVILQDHETSRNRHGDLGTLLIRSHLRFGEVRATTQAMLIHPRMSLSGAAVRRG
jgi:hypothetical protein